MTDTEKASLAVFKSPRATTWTRERVAKLDRAEVLRLQANAVRLGEPEVADVCADVLQDLPERGPLSSGAAARRKSGARLIPRTQAFQARGIWLYEPSTSWSGIRKSDGAVVFALWFASIQSEGGACRTLLWAPNTDGGRPWSDSPAGRERRDHCMYALARGSAHGLLMHGETLPDRLPEERAHTVAGVDPETLIDLQVEQRGPEFWAVWGKAAAARLPTPPA